MSALSPSPRHPWEQLLAQLTGRSGLTHIWGDENDAKIAPVDRIVWTPQGESTVEPRKFNVPQGAQVWTPTGLITVAGAVTVGLLAVLHVVTIYGGSPAVAVQREVDLQGQIDLLAGPPGGSSSTTPVRPGYDIRKGGKAAKGGELGAGAWMVQPTVTLKAFIFRELFGSGVVATVPISVIAEDALGNNPEAGPPASTRPVP